jgi:hypothetical protein
MKASVTLTLGIVTGLMITFTVARAQQAQPPAPQQSIEITAAQARQSSAQTAQTTAPTGAQGTDEQTRLLFFNTEFARIRRGFQIAPVRLDLSGKDLTLVGLGSYLVNAAGGCNDCHTNPPYAEGGNPFQGQQKRVNTANYLAGGTPFGVAISANITPNAQTGLPAGLTWPQFRDVLRTGLDPETHQPLQVMPWPVYQDMVDRDLRAIYEYLRAIPHAEPAS